MRDTYRYHFLVDDKIVYTGITDDLDRRERYLCNRFKAKDGYLEVVDRAVELLDGLTWESEQAKQGRLTRWGALQPETAEVA